MNKFSFRAIGYPTIVLTVICVVVAFALAGTNLLTSDSIDALNKNNRESAMNRILPAESYEESTTTYENQKYSYFKAADKGYVFTTSAKGYGGDVIVMTGIDAGGTITAVEILDVSGETPGLGQNAKNPTFAESFKGKSSEIAPGSVDALTGATLTTNAVINSVNTAVKLYQQIGKAGE